MNKKPSTWDDTSLPTRRGMSPFSGRGPWPQIWRRSPSTQLRCAPVRAGDHGRMTLTGPHHLQADRILRCLQNLQNDAFGLFEICCWNEAADLFPQKHRFIVGLWSNVFNMCVTVTAAGRQTWRNMWRSPSPTAAGWESAAPAVWQMWWQPRVCICTLTCAVFISSGDIFHICLCVKDCGCEMNGIWKRKEWRKDGWLRRKWGGGGGSQRTSGPAAMKGLPAAQTCTHTHTPSSGNLSNQVRWFVVTRPEFSSPKQKQKCVLVLAGNSS